MTNSTMGCLISAACGLLAAVAAPEISRQDTLGFVWYWSLAGAGSGLAAAVPIGGRYVSLRDERRRSRMRQAIGQFLPVLAAGAVVTILLTRQSPALVPLLPGLWALLFALGLAAARPHLPRRIAWAAGYYGAAGTLLLWFAYADAIMLSPWTVGGTFGAGQILAAGMLRRRR